MSRSRPIQAGSRRDREKFKDRKAGGDDSRVGACLAVRPDMCAGRINACGTRAELAVGAFDIAVLHRFARSGGSVQTDGPPCRILQVCLRLTGESGTPSRTDSFLVAKKLDSRNPRCDFLTNRSRYDSRASRHQSQKLS